MKNILKTICDKSRSELERAKAELPFGRLCEIALSRSGRASFRAALTPKCGTPAIIAEMKKASPSRGLIRENFNPRELCVSLEKSGASALSVLTEKNYFLGNLEYLRDASELVNIPLLRKDFIFDKYQIAEARACGASAVLLIAKMLSSEEYRELSAFAKYMGLDVLSEAHDESELDMLIENGADIIGINCRNLESFRLDFSAAERLLKKIPRGIVKVAESGVDGRDILLRAYEAGADAALIGTLLMSDESPSAALEKLLARL